MQSWRLTLGVIAILILLVAIIWLAVKPGFDVLIILLTGSLCCLALWPVGSGCGWVKGRVSL